VLHARIRFVFLWVSQVARIMADWALRFAAFFEARRLADWKPESAWYLATAVFIVPWIVLAPFHGFLSNSLPKRWVLVGSNLVCLGAVLLFVPTGGPWVWSLGVMALGSALFSPARYALLPAVAQDTRWPLASVTGWIDMGGYAAVIAGSVLGLSVKGDLRPGLPWIIVIILAANAVAVLAAYPCGFPSDVRRPESLLRGLAGFFRDTGRVFRDPIARGSLLGLAAFLGVVTAASGAAVNVVLQGGLSHAGGGAAGLSLAMIAIGIAVGCVLAGLQGNPRRCLGLVPFGISVLVVSQFWGILAGEAGVAPPLPSLLMGMMTGLASVPLRAIYQMAVPADARGNAMSVLNTIIYLFTTAVAVLMYGLIELRVLPTETMQLFFLLCLEIAGAILAWRLLFRQAVELVLEVVLWPFYRVRLHGPGVGRVPMHGPLIVVANHTSYFDPFWVGKVMPRRLRPLMTSRFFDLPLVRWLMIRIVGAIRVPQVRFRRQAPELADAVAVVQDGGCLLMFPEAILRRKERPILRTFGQGIWHILREAPETPVVVLWIEGGWGSWASYKGGPPMRHKRIDVWRRIDVALQEPEVLDPAILADHRTTRRYLMRRCLEARRYLGLDVPGDALPPTLDMEEPPEEEEAPPEPDTLSQAPP